MKERPILFSAPMVRAILDGRKTQTRRLMLPEHAPVAVEPYDTPGVRIYRDNGNLLREWYVLTPEASALLWWRRPGTEERPTKARLRMSREWDLLKETRGERQRWSIDELVGLCPHGKPGDRLWVRETWSPASREHHSVADFPADGRPRDSENYWAWYAAEDDAEGPWIPSIFMPRWASRITLEITEVRVQRLQEISGRDVFAEGVDNGKSNPAQGVRWENMQRLAFESLWDSINGKPLPMLDDDGEPVLDDNDKPRMVASRSWSSNPWVWALTFRRLP